MVDPPKPSYRLAAQRARELCLTFGGAFLPPFWAKKGSWRARFERAQGLCTDIPLSHAAPDLGPMCLSQRIRPPRLRLVRNHAQPRATMLHVDPKKGGRENSFLKIDPARSLRSGSHYMPPRASENGLSAVGKRQPHTFLTEMFLRPTRPPHVSVSQSVSQSIPHSYQPSTWSTYIHTLGHVVVIQIVLSDFTLDNPRIQPELCLMFL